MPPNTDLLFTDDLPFLVRENIEASVHRRPPTPRSFPRCRSYAYPRFPEMGVYNSVDHPGQSERDSTGSSVHLPVEKVQCERERKERQRIPIDDSRVDAGQ